MAITKIPNLTYKTPRITPLYHRQNEGHRSAVAILRLDEIHPVISGNKWFKLRYNLEAALAKNHSSLLTFGGAYSNHLIATAAAAKEAGLKSIGIIRGYHSREHRTPTLLACEAMGMHLHVVSREAYKRKEDAAWLSELEQQFPGAYILPEGGNNDLGKKGVTEIAAYIPENTTHIAVSVGSGTTLAGLRNALPEHIKLLGFVPMKNGKYLMDKTPSAKGNWEWIDEYHFGGFGKWNEELLGFMNDFYKHYQVPLDVVYTAKMMYGVQRLWQQQYFPIRANVLCIHTGGLQGNISVKERLVF